MEYPPQMDARAERCCATDSMENDSNWQRLGSVVWKIVRRAEVTDGPPVAQADADLFVLMLRDVYAPQQQAEPRCTKGQKP
jgi:hypothetical protein